MKLETLFKISLRRLRTVIIVAAVVPTVTSAHGSDETSLPKAETILDRYVEVTGGKAAYGKLEDSVMKGTLEFVGAGVRGPVIMHRARPDRSIVTIDGDGIGLVHDGVIGGVAWSSNAMMGPQIKEGEERASSLREAQFDGIVEWCKLYRAETVGSEPVGDVPCHKVKLTPTEGRPTYQYFDKKTGLLVRFETELETSMGLMALSTVVSDWREVDGIRVPFIIEQAMGDIQKVKITWTSVEHNTGVAASTFDPPEEVQKLIAKQLETK